MAALGEDGERPPGAWRPPACAAALPWLLLLAVGQAGCHGARAGAEAVVTVAGSTSLQAFAQAWAEAWRARPGAVPITVQAGGSTTGVRLVASGAVDVATVSRPLHPGERGGLAETLVGHEAIALVVADASPVVALRLDEARAILTGRTTRWSEVGGPDRPIRVVTREHGSGTRGAIEELLLGGDPVTDAALVGESAAVVREMVRADPDAIGYLSLGQAALGVRPLILDGVAATEESAASGRYPVVRPLLLVTREARPAAAGRFIDFVLSPDGQALLRAQGYVPVRP